MRIIAGKLGGRVVNPPIKRWPTRPTTDRTREALFNILDNRVIWSEVSGLELFGGTGLISLEMISRGAANVDYVEQYAPAVKFVQKTAEVFDVANRMRICQRDVFRFIDRCNEKYDLIFADPPYQMFRSRELPKLILSNELLNSEGLLIIEHDSSVLYDKSEGFVEKRQYGQSLLSFFMDQ